MNINFKRTLALISISIMIFSVFVSVIGNINAEDTITETENTTAIFGYVTDAETGKPLVEVEVAFNGYYKVDPLEEPASDGKEPADVPPPDDEYLYMTFTDENGYYKLSVPTDAGELQFYLDGYYDSVQRIEPTTDTLWLNVTLKPVPPPPEPDAVLKGVVTDEDTGLPISGVMLSLYLDDYYYDYTNELAEPPKEATDEDSSVDSGSGSSADETVTDVEEPERYDKYETYWFDGKTSSTGEYSVELYGGNYWLSANIFVDSYDSKVNEYYPVYTHVEVADNTTTYYNFTMKALPPRDAYITGYVTDSETGKPVANMGLSVYKISTGDDDTFDIKPEYGVPGAEYGFDSSFYIDDSGYAITDSDGYYMLNLRPGTYAIYTTYYYYAYDERGYPEDDGASYSDAVAAGGTRGVDESESSADGVLISPGYDEIYYYPEDEYYPFTATVVVESKDTAWLNISLKPIPPKNSKVTGKVTDASTGKALSNAYINLIGYTQGYQNYYWAVTDSNGEYEVQVREGFYVISVNYYYYESYEKYDNVMYDETGSGTDPGVPSDREPVPPPPVDDGKRYFPYSASFKVGSSKTVTQNVKMDPYPDEDSTISGKITDKNSGGALPNVYIKFVIDYNGHEYSKYVWTDAEGKYSVAVPGSEVTIVIDSYYYYSKYDDEMYWTDAESDNGAANTKSRVSVDTPPEPPVDEKPYYTSYFGYRTTLKIGTSESLTHDIVLEQIPPLTCTITGTVTDSDNKPVAYGWVTLIDFEHYMGDNNMFGMQSWTDENGRYLLQSYPGEFTLVADRSWLLGVDGTATHLETLTVNSDTKELTKDIKLGKAENNKLKLLYEFESWQEVDFTATMTLNENAFGFRYYIDHQFGDNDGTVDLDEVADYLESWLLPQGFAPFGLLSVDSVTYHPKPGTEPSISVLTTDEVTPSDSVKSTDPFIFRIKMELVPYKSISETQSEHDVELTLNNYLPAEITYDIVLPSGSKVTGYSDNSGENMISGLGGNNVMINAPFDNYAWYNIYGQRAYKETGGADYDANLDPGMMIGAPEPPKADDGSEGGNKDSTYSQTISDGSETIRLKVTSPVHKSDSETGTLSGTQKAAITASIIIVVILVALMMLISRRRGKPKRPETDERIPQPTEDHRTPPTRPVPPSPNTPPNPPIEK